jgi:glycosyltransferase involved in cell wall biosynthesis
MHRSGTSMVARLLNLCGVYLGPESDIFATAPDNPDGFWENVNIVNLNDAILEKLGASWDKPPELDKDWELQLDLLPYRAKAIQIIDQFKGSEPWGWKDPRNSLTAQFWMQLIPNQKFVICLRNPLEVSKSLTKRGSSSKLFGFDLWLAYNKNIIKTIAPQQCIITHFDSYFVNPRLELERILTFLGISAADQQINTAINSINNPLRHNSVNMVDLLDQKPPYEVVKIYQNMCLQAGSVYEGVKGNDIVVPLISVDDYERFIEERERNRLWQALQEKDKTLQEITKLSRDKERDLQEQVLQKEKLLQDVFNSKAWKLVEDLRKIRVWLVPSDSLRERIVRLVYFVLRKIFRAFRKIVSGWKYFSNFYTNYGATATFSEFTKRFGNKKKSYKDIIENFPSKFADKQISSHTAPQWKELIDSSAQISMENLMNRLNISADAIVTLTKLKESVWEHEYYRILEDLFSFEHFVTETSDGTKYPLNKATELPKIVSNHRKRRILFITSEFPNPLHGGGNRVLNFIKILSEENEIYLATSYVPQKDEKWLQTIASYFCAIYKIPHWKFNESKEEIRKWLKNTSIDIVHYEWPHSLTNYDPLFGAKHIFTYMESVSLRLLMDLNRSEVLSKIWLEKLKDLIRALRLEVVDSATMDARIAVTNKDGEFFKKLYPYQEYTVLNHGVSFDEFSLPDVTPEPRTLVFVGNYAHYPNFDAMRYFFSEIWQNIIKILPDVRIYIVGTNPPSELAQLSDGKRVIVTGDVSDVRPYIQKASVCIAPLITGAGLRGKVIEYAALRRPFVATTIAVTDLAFKDGTDYLCADSATEFAQNVVTLLKDKRLREQMATNAYKIARENYDTRYIVEYLYRFYDYLERKQSLEWVS